MTVILDAREPAFEGKRVVVVLESADELALPADEAATAWENWLKRGPDGPLAGTDGDLL